MHILWISEFGSFVGGCERYVSRTVALLRERGARASFLYDASQPTDAAYLRHFDAAFPMADLGRQVAAIRPDLVYVHRLSGAAPAAALGATSRPTFRFFHDHQLFCLREHKYTTIRHRTCTRTVGAACYPCLGFINRSQGWPGVRLRSVARVRREQDANRGLTGFVVGSRYMAEHVAAHGFSRERIHVVPLFADPPAPLVPDEREPGLLLFVGQVVRGKGLDVLLHALALCRAPLRLVVAGAGRQVDLHRELAAKLGLADRVSWTGLLRGEDVEALYRRAACVVVPSRRPETFGLVGPEAMRYGTPVIATTIGGVGEWLVHGETGLGVPSDDPRALATEIERLLGDPALWHRLSKGARALYESRFRPERHVETLLALFRSAAGAA